MNSVRPTSADVARLAGVSRATVSYVLNDVANKTITDETRARVHAAVAELHYHPSAAARALRAGRSRIVLFIVPHWPNSTAIIDVLEATSVELAARGLTLLTHFPPRGAHALEDILANVTPAIVVTDAILGADDARVLKELDIAHLSLGIYDAESPEVSLALWRVGNAQARALAERGHRYLAYVPHPDPAFAPFARRRARGAESAARELSLPAISVRPARDTVDGIVADMATWDPRITGVITYNDEVATAVLLAARAAGPHVPDQLSIVGADDLAAGQLSSPRIATVKVDPTGAALEFADAICGRIGLDTATYDGNEFVSFEARESIAKAPAVTAAR